MSQKRVKVIVFKSDRVGDLIYFSPCLKVIKDNITNSHITLVCSKYNYQVAKNYNFIDKFIVIEKKNILNLILLNFKVLFFTKYKYLFQFDGKNYSYLISYFVQAKIKSTICFIKHKSLFNFNYKISRPAKMLLRIFYKYHVMCDEKYEDYNNKKTHYQSLYFELLKKLNFTISTKKNIFNLENKYYEVYKLFSQEEIKSPYILFHIDERWNIFSENDYKNILHLIYNLSDKNKVIITTGIKNFKFLYYLEKQYKLFDYINEQITPVNSIDNKKLIIIKNLPLNLLAYFIKNSDKNISAHSGPIVHISAAFDKFFIDIIKKNKNDELDRWIPLISKYKRINFENLNINYINTLKDEF